MDAGGYPHSAAMDLFQTHVILPVQHFNSPKEITPELRLMIAVLADAVWCLEKFRVPTDARGRRTFHRAKQWLLASEPDWPYSFERICAALDLNASAVRHRFRDALDLPPVPGARALQPTTRVEARA